MKKLPILTGISQHIVCFKYMVTTGLGAESRSHDAHSVNSQAFLTPALQARHDRLKNTECLKYMKHLHSHALSSDNV